MNQSKKKSTGIRSQAVQRALRRAILEQALEPGTKLPEDGIGERFGVSRTLVREALVRLSEEGLVEMRPNRGATVSQPSLDDGHDLFRIRFALEELVVELLSGNLSKEQLTALTSQIEAEHRADGEQQVTGIRLAGEFHVMLAAMTGNSILEKYINELVSRSTLVLSLYGRRHSNECSASEHQEILDAIQKGDTDRAKTIMREHLKSITTRALVETAIPPSMQDVLSLYAKAEGLT